MIKLLPGSILYARQGPENRWSNLTRQNSSARLKTRFEVLDQGYSRPWPITSSRYPSAMGEPISLVCPGGCNWHRPSQRALVFLLSAPSHTFSHFRLGFGCGIYSCAGDGGVIQTIKRSCSTQISTCNPRFCRKSGAKASYWPASRP